LGIFSFSKTPQPCASAR